MFKQKTANRKDSIDFANIREWEPLRVTEYISIYNNFICICLIISVLDFGVIKLSNINLTSMF